MYDRIVISYVSIKEVEKITNQEYLVQLMDQYQNLVYSICLKYTKDRYTAEDLAQDTFFSAYLHLNSFDRENEKAWIARIASNKCLDYLKSASRRIEYMENYEKVEDGVLETNTGAEDVFLKQDEREKIRMACESLSPPYNQVARQYFYEEKTAKEIAQGQNLSVKTVQTQIYRARSKLQEELIKEGLNIG